MNQSIQLVFSSHLLLGTLKVQQRLGITCSCESLTWREPDVRGGVPPPHPSPNTLSLSLSLPLSLSLKHTHQTYMLSHPHTQTRIPFRRPLIHTNNTQPCRTYKRAHRVELCWKSSPEHPRLIRSQVWRFSQGGNCSKGPQVLSRHRLYRSFLSHQLAKKKQKNTNVCDL